MTGIGSYSCPAAQVVLKKSEYYEKKEDKFLLIVIIFSLTYRLPKEMIWSMCKEKSLLPSR